jgi:hypothetical protein
MKRGKTARVADRPRKDDDVRQAVAPDVGEQELVVARLRIEGEHESTRTDGPALGGPNLGLGERLLKLRPLW